MLLGRVRLSRGPLLCLPDPEVPEHVVVDRAGLLSEPRPVAGLDGICLGLQVLVGDGDLLLRPFGIGAPAGPARVDTVVAVEDGFDG